MQLIAVDALHIIASAVLSVICAVAAAFLAVSAWQAVLQARRNKGSLRCALALASPGRVYQRLLQRPAARAAELQLTFITLYICNSIKGCAL